MNIPTKFNKLQIHSKQNLINQLIIYKSASWRIFLDQSSKRRIIVDTMNPLMSRIQTDVCFVNGKPVCGPNYTQQYKPHPDYFQLSNNSKIILSLNISMCCNSSCTNFVFTDKKDISFSPGLYTSSNPCIINYNANTIFYLTATINNCTCPK